MHRCYMYKTTRLFVCVVHIELTRVQAASCWSLTSESTPVTIACVGGGMATMTPHTHEITILTELA